MGWRWSAPASAPSSPAAIAAEDVIEESGIEFQADEEVQPGLVTASSLADLDPEEFRRFLENVTVEEFASSLELGDEDDAEADEEEDEPE